MKPPSEMKPLEMKPPEMKPLGAGGEGRVDAKTISSQKTEKTRAKRPVFP